MLWRVGAGIVLLAALCRERRLRPVALLASDRSCNSNAECGADMFCYGGTFLWKGHCDYRLSFGERCYRDNDICRSGYICGQNYVCVLPVPDIYARPPPSTQVLNPNPDLYDWSKPHWHFDGKCRACGERGRDGAWVGTGCGDVCRYGDPSDPLRGLIACGINTGDYNANTFESRGGQRGFVSERDCEVHGSETALGEVREFQGAPAECMNRARYRHHVPGGFKLPGHTYLGCLPLAAGQACTLPSECQSAVCDGHVCGQLASTGETLRFPCAPSEPYPWDHGVACVEGRQVCADLARPTLEALARAKGTSVKELCRCGRFLHPAIVQDICSKRHFDERRVPIVRWRVLERACSGLSYSWESGTQRSATNSTARAATKSTAGQMLQLLEESAPVVALLFGGVERPAKAFLSLAKTQLSLSTRAAYTEVVRRDTSVVSRATADPKSHCDNDVTRECRSNADCARPSDGRCLGLSEADGRVTLAAYDCSPRYPNGNCQRDDLWVATFETLGSEAFVDALAASGSSGEIRAITRTVPAQSSRTLVPRWPDVVCADPAVDPFCQFLAFVPDVEVEPERRRVLESQVCQRNLANASLNRGMTPDGLVCDYHLLVPAATYP